MGKVDLSAKVLLTIIVFVSGREKGKHGSECDENLIKNYGSS